MSKSRSYSATILDVLKEVKRGGNFYASGRFPCWPGLQVDGVGVISFPVRESDTLAIISQCKPRHVGHRMKRSRKDKEDRSWELATSGFSLKNPHWDASIQTLLDGDLWRALGLPDGAQLESRLSRLLVYQQGDAFELEMEEPKDGTLGTLAVFLPSSNGAGNLLVHHAADGTACSSQTHPHEPWYAAYYGCCKTEIQPPQQGYGLCLLYDLSVDDPRHASIAPPENDQSVARLAEAVRSWARDPKAPKLFALPLDQDYSEETLSKKELTAEDQAKVDVLRASLREIGVRPSSTSAMRRNVGPAGRVCLAMLEFKESGSARQTTYEGSYELDEVFQSEVSAELLVGLEEDLDTPDIPDIRMSEVLPEGFIDNLDWDSEKMIEDDVMEKLYSAAAIIVWRPDLIGSAAT